MMTSLCAVSMVMLQKQGIEGYGGRLSGGLRSDDVEVWDWMVASCIVFRESLFAWMRCGRIINLYRVG